MTEDQMACPAISDSQCKDSLLSPFDKNICDVVP